MRRYFAGLLATIAFLMYSGTTDGQSITILQYPGAFSTIPIAISSTGQIVGTWYIYGPGATSGNFLYYNGTFSNLTIPGLASPATITGINAQGWMTGPGWIYANGVLTTVGATLTGITDSGATWPIGAKKDPGPIACGWLQPTGGGYQGCVYFDGGILPLPYVSTTLWTINGISNASTLIGSNQDAKGNVNGFIYQNGTYTWMPAPPSFTTPTVGVAIYKATFAGINSSGVVVGSYTAPQYGYLHGGINFAESIQSFQAYYYIGGITYLPIEIPAGLVNGIPGILVPCKATGINDSNTVIGVCGVLPWDMSYGFIAQLP